MHLKAVARVSLLGLAGCTGAIADAPSAARPSSPVAAASAGDRGGALPLVRLTREQYVNTLRDLLGDDAALAVDLPYDVTGDSGFFAPGSIGTLEARRFMEIAESAAARASADPARVPDCERSPSPDPCVRSFIDRFGRRAFRRPLGPDEVSALHAHYAAARERWSSTGKDAMRVLVATMLQAPSFLYRWELGPRPALSGRDQMVALDGHEMASRLSYFLWGSMPDEALFTAADDGRLGTVAEVGQQARRLLAHAKARPLTDSFFAQWLRLGEIPQLEKDSGSYPEFDAGLRAAMAAESRAFVAHVLFEGDGRLRTLFESNVSFVDDKLAKLYGLPALGATTPQRRELSLEQRFGLLTQAGFLAVHSHASDSAPIKRGLTVRERLLCQTVPPPPANVNAMPPKPDPNIPLRDQLARHSQDPACKGCHTLLDPVGFAFEAYDGIGRFRTTSGGRPVDATGVLTGIANGDRMFTGARELVTLLLDGAELRRCVATQWLRFALGRRNESEDTPSLDAALAGFERSGLDLRELIVAITRTPSFRFRSLARGEIAR